MTATKTTINHRTYGPQEWPIVARSARFAVIRKGTATERHWWQLAELTTGKIALTYGQGLRLQSASHAAMLVTALEAADLPAVPDALLDSRGADEAARALGRAWMLDLVAIAVDQRALLANAPVLGWSRPR